MTTKLLDAFKQDLESLTLTPFGDGRFEVLVDGETVYSKLATGEFPNEDAVVKDIQGR